MITIDVTHPAIGWNAKDYYFGAELSSLDNPELDYHCRNHLPITVKNPKTGAEVTMTWTKDDKDGSGEDTYGYNYIGYSKGTGRHFTFLFIND